MQIQKVCKKYAKSMQKVRKKYAKRTDISIYKLQS